MRGWWLASGDQHQHTGSSGALEVCLPRIRGVFAPMRWQRLLTYLLYGVLTALSLVELYKCSLLYPNYKEQSAHLWSNFDREATAVVREINDGLPRPAVNVE